MKGKLYTKDGKFLADVYDIKVTSPLTPQRKREDMAELLKRTEGATDIRQVPGYPQHALTDNGHLFRLNQYRRNPDGHACDVFINQRGYRAAYVWRGKKKSKHPKPIYKLMAVTYHGKKPFKGALIRHLDGNSQNDHRDNLAWGTREENAEDLRKHNKDRAKLTKALRAEIQEMLKEEYPNDVAEHFNVGYPTVYRIHTRMEKENG